MWNKYVVACVMESTTVQEIALIINWLLSADKRDDEL